MSWLLAGSIPLIVGLFWPIYSLNPDSSSYILRPPVFAAAMLLALLWSHALITAAEVRMSAYMVTMCVTLLIPSMASTNPSRALTDLVKLTMLCIVALAVSRALRDPVTAKVFALALIGISILCAFFILVSYVQYKGVVLPTYKSAREFKGMAVKHAIPLNAVAFTSVFSYIMGMCVLRANFLLGSLGFFLLVVTTVFTGSRAPVGVLVLAVFVLLLMNAWRGRKLWVRAIGYAMAVAIFAALFLVLFRVPFKRMTEITEGRWDLWSVAVAKFTESPLIGYGFESWRDDLVSRLPGEYQLTSNIASNIAGGYHNEYLTMLAEQGLIGSIPVIAFFMFLLSLCWKLAFRQWHTWHRGQWALFGCLFLMVRGNVEMPGLFGYGQEPSDFLAWLFVALTLSRFSIEEDWLRDNALVPVPRRAGRLRPVNQWAKNCTSSSQTFPATAPTENSSLPS